MRSSILVMTFSSPSQHCCNVEVVQDELVDVAAEIAHLSGHVLPHRSQLFGRLLVVDDGFVH